MYQAGIYCRISIEEQNKEGEYSNSIHSQIQMARDYIAENKDIAEKKVYVDDGASGSNFERTEFRRMLADIELGVINMVIFKDVSRLGREHIDTNYYLGKYFPEKQIRIVSILDNYDSAVGTYDEMLEIKTLLNDMYLRDTSRKIKTTIQTKRSMGEYTPKQPPFGYVKSKTIHNHLEIDPYAAEVVRRIYRMYQNGFGCTVICRTLNEDEIPCPAKYKKEVLKTNYVSYKVEKYQYIPEEQQYIVEGMHEAIISKDTFEQVQELMKKRTRTPGFNSEVRKVNPYAGIIVCGDCGYNFQRVTCRDGYECGTYHKKGNTVCYSHFIKKEVLDSIVKNEIQRQAELALKESDKDEILKVADRKKEVQRRCAEADQQIERLQKELAAVQKYKKKTYENYVDGVLDKEEYLSYKAEYEKQDKDIRAKIQLAEQEKDSFGEAEESYENWIEKFIKYGTLSEVTREIVTELIEKIVVNGDKSIDIVFKYQSPYPVEKQAV